VTGVQYQQTLTTALGIPVINELSWQHAWFINEMPPCSYLEIAYGTHPLSSAPAVYLFFQDPNYQLWLRSPNGSLFQVLLSAGSRAEIQALAYQAPLFPVHDMSGGRNEPGCSSS